MKIFIAQSTASALAGHDSYRQSLCTFLDGHGHKTQCLDLPSIAVPGRALTNIASLRLLGTAASADALICLDPVAAVLDHPRKIVMLLDDSYLVGAWGQLAHERAFDRAYVADVLRSSLQEAKHIFSPSRFARDRLRELSFERTEMLQPALPLVQFHYQRNPGPELLVLSKLNDRQRPELLVGCLAALPEPFRARWIAPGAEAPSVARLRELARSAEVEQRLVIDVRVIVPGEAAFLLSQAAAYLELAPASLAVCDKISQALQAGAPVITCTDGGAVTEVSSPTAPRQAKPDSVALAAAVRAATAGATVEPSRRAPYAPIATENWTPMLKALSQ